MGCSSCGRNKKRKKKTKVNIIPKFDRSDERLIICRECEYKKWDKRDNLHCEITNKFLPMSARIKEETCPKGKWRNLKERN